MQSHLSENRVIPLARFSPIEFVEEMMAVEIGHDLEKILTANGLDTAVDHACRVSESDTHCFAGTPFVRFSEDCKDVIVVCARLRAGYQGRLHKPLQEVEKLILRYLRTYVRKNRELNPV